MARRAPEENPVAEIAEQVERKVHRKAAEPTKKRYKTEELAPTGLTLLNLACSENPFGGYALGGIVTIPGASSSGKTFLALTSLAEAALLSRFDKYQLIHDDAEERRAFDLPFLFGKEIASRIVDPPNGISPGIQQFEANVLSLAKAGTPFIYILDSFDSLTSDEELEKEMRKALAMAKSEEAAKKIAGSYGTEKAKIAGQTLRIINNKLKESNSILIILQQLRQKLNAPPFSDPYCTAGGEAPFFYSNHQIRMYKGKDIKRSKLVVGSEAIAKLKKNSITGKLREASFSIYTDYGVDDIGSCVNFLIDEDYWKKNGRNIKAPELEWNGNYAEFLSAIGEQEDMYKELVRTVARYWRERERKVETKRPSKYR